MKLPFRACLGLSMIMILPFGQCPRLWESTALSVYNGSTDTTPGCCSSNWLTQLQQSWCPLLRLLILGLVTLPIYNAVLILVGWLFHCSTKSNAEHFRLDTRPKKHPTPQSPLVPPKPPPRIRRRLALSSPKRPSTSAAEPVPYPNHKNPFAEHEQYQVLRRNLQLVLKGLQNPPLEIASPMLPESIIKRSEIPSEILSDVASLCPSEVQKKRSKVIFKRLWQKWRSRNKLKKSKKSLVSVSSSSCSSTNVSSCFYVYLEET
ncbi:hypothetical protein KR059_004990 [Drosophila kikkawai]|nr:hypothetical protein KR059_004990 [Drosophila kikkawai]